jgi:uncharacterized protein with PQ loop repeat
MISEIIFYVSSIAFVVYGVPQIFKMYKEPDSAKGFSILAWSLLTLAIDLTFINMILTKTSIKVMIPYFVNLVSVNWIEVLLLKFKMKK